MAESLSRIIFEFDKKDETIKETPMIKDLANEITAHQPGDEWSLSLSHTHTLYIYVPLHLFFWFLFF